MENTGKDIDTSWADNTINEVARALHASTRQALEDEYAKAQTVGSVVFAAPGLTIHDKPKTPNLGSISCGRLVTAAENTANRFKTLSGLLGTLAHHGLTETAEFKALLASLQEDAGLLAKRLEKEREAELAEQRKAKRERCAAARAAKAEQS
jgi:hypothetical protein